MRHPPPPGQEAAFGIVHDCLIVSVPDNPGGDGFDMMRRSAMIAASDSMIKGVVFDVSSAGMLDSVSFRHVTDTARMLSLLGKETCFSGFQPGVVAALVGMGVDTGTLRAFRTLEVAIGFLRESREIRNPPDEEAQENGEEFSEVSVDDSQ